MAGGMGFRTGRPKPCFAALNPIDATAQRNAPPPSGGLHRPSTPRRPGIRSRRSADPAERRESRGPARDGDRRHRCARGNPPRDVPGGSSSVGVNAQNLAAPDRRSLWQLAGVVVARGQIEFAIRINEPHLTTVMRARPAKGAIARLDLIGHIIQDIGTPRDISKIATHSKPHQTAGLRAGRARR